MHFDTGDCGRRYKITLMGGDVESIHTYDLVLTYVHSHLCIKMKERVSEKFCILLSLHGWRVCE